MLKDGLYTGQIICTERDGNVDAAQKCPLTGTDAWDIFFLPFSDSVTSALYRLLVVRFCTVHFDKLVNMGSCMHVLIRPVRFS